MKIPFTLTIIIATCVTAFSQETAPLEEARNAARKVNEYVRAFSDLAIAVEADTDRPHLLKGGGGGVMIVPDKNVTSAALGTAAEKITPLGQLWLHKGTVAKEGQATSSEKAREVVVTADNRDYHLHLFLLGTEKNASGTLDLVVFAKDKEPLLRVPVQSSTSSQELPVELSGEKTGEDSATLTLRLFGQYKADLPLVRKAD
jgi:hypothetical protein